jgi:hypothetical protein
MNQPFRRPYALALGAFLWILSANQLTVVAQEMQHGAPSTPSTELTIKTYDGKTLHYTPDEFAALPHKTVAVFNAHSKKNENYSGVLLSDLLGKAGVPLGENVRGKLFMTGIVAEGTDHYGVLYSLAEVDPSIHTGDVIVADMVDGQKLTQDGAFRMISSEERRPARWVRNLTSISVVKVEP